MRSGQKSLSVFSAAAATRSADLTFPHDAPERVQEERAPVSTVLWIIAILLVIIGLIGIVVPALPGVVLVFIGLLFGAWADGFKTIGWGTLVLLAVLMVLSLIADFFATSLGVKRAGASTSAVAGAMIGTVAGLFFGFLGIVIGPFIGAAVGEYLVRRNMAQASKAGLGTWAGIILSAAVRLALAFSMIGLFVISYILNR